MYGYAPMQIPSGVIAHHFNRPSRQILVCMLLLCLLNFAIPFALRAADWHARTAVLYCLMVPLGMAQALMNPSLHKLIASWAPVNERTRVHNTIYAGQNAGKMVATASSALIASSLGWAAVFWVNSAICGCFGVAWICAVSDTPARDPRISAAERDHIRLTIHADSRTTAEEEHPSFFELPWRSILTSAPFFAILVNHFAYDWGTSTIDSWLPTYLKQELDFDLKHSGLISTIPQIAGFVVVMLSGPLALAALERRWISVTTLRKLAQGVGLLAPAALLALLCVLHDVSRFGAVALLTAATAFGGLTYSGHHINHIDLSPTFAPILYGSTNTLANVAKIVSPLVNGGILGTGDDPGEGAWHRVFLLSAAVQAVAGLVWLLLASGRRQKWG